MIVSAPNHDCTCTMVAYFAGGKYRVYRSPRDDSILANTELSSASVMPLAASYSWSRAVVEKTHIEVYRVLHNESITQRESS